MVNPFSSKVSKVYRDLQVASTLKFSSSVIQG